jgi:hypothetical protein
MKWPLIDNHPVKEQQKVPDDRVELLEEELEVRWNERVEHPDGRVETRERYTRLGRRSRKVATTALVVGGLLLVGLLLRPELAETVLGAIPSLLRGPGT